MLPTLTLTGRLDPVPAKLTPTEKRDWLARAAVWFETAGDAVLAAEPSEGDDGKPVLCVCYHPAADDVEVRLSQSGVVRVTARTWPAGPGYHAYLCAGLEAFAADVGVKWDHADDSTGFARSGDAAVLSEHFLAALRGGCRGLLPHRHGAAALGLATGHGFTHPGPVLTPLGPRSWEWVAAVAADPTAGMEVFPWWSPDLDAEFYRSRAAALMWTEFPWRPPLTEDEGELTDQVAADLEMAYSLDPAGPLPWREWAEVLTAIERDRSGFTVQTAEPELRRTVLERAAGLDLAEPRVGYRRYPVRVAVGGWSVEVPGSFADGWVDDRTWVGWEGARRVTLRIGGPRLSCEPAFVQDRQGWHFTGTLSVGGESLAYQIEAADPADREWAAGVWRSLLFAGILDSRSSAA